VVQRVAPVLPVDRDQGDRPPVLQVDHRRRRPGSITAAS
jgi:hypothetical protein